MTTSESPRSTERLMLIMDALANAPARGLRLTDIVDVTGLGKTTAHRLINGLVEQGLVELDDETSRFFVGLKLLEWAGAASKRFSISRLIEPAVIRIARAFEDTVYLIIRHGDHAVCVDCYEGTFPIKVLTLRVGDKRPLGIGAGSLAILASLDDQDVERILLQQKSERESFAISEELLRRRLNEARAQGHAYNDVHVFPDMENITGMAAVAVAIRRPDGSPIGAIHVTSITERLAKPRRSQIVQALLGEVDRIERDLAPLIDGPSHLLRSET